MTLGELGQAVDRRRVPTNVKGRDVELYPENWGGPSVDVSAQKAFTRPAPHPPDDTSAAAEILALAKRFGLTPEAAKRAYDAAKRKSLKDIGKR